MPETHGAGVGVSDLHVSAAMRGETLDAFRKTRAAPGALHSVAGTAATDPKWDRGAGDRTG